MRSPSADKSYIHLDYYSAMANEAGGLPPNLKTDCVALRHNEYIRRRGEERRTCSSSILRWPRQS